MQKKKDKRKREEESAEKKKKKVGRLNDCGCVCLYQPQRFAGFLVSHPSIRDCLTTEEEGQGLGLRSGRGGSSGSGRE